MSKRVMYLICVALLSLAISVQAARDITGPGDVIQGVPNEGVSLNDDHGWPGNEPPHQAIDDQVVTKYLHFKGDKETTGLRITPQIGSTVVIGLSLTTANDAEARDPVQYELYGSNESIDGPYTLIASGDIVDFDQQTAWPRRTQGTTPIRFENTVAYEHYQLMFPVVRDPGGANSMQIAEIELLMDVLKATLPDPADGAVVTMPLFRWSPGDTALFHNVYFGTSPDLTEADLQSAHTPMTLYYHPLPIEPGVMYYWRIDEVDNAGTVYTGDVWSVLAAPKKAYNSLPRDGDKWLPVTTQLSWEAGAGATSHDVYFGTDEAAVAARDASVSQGSTIAATFDPGALQEQTTYYWAVDETGAGTMYSGDVWSFTTLGASGGVLGEYFSGTTPGGVPVLTRIDDNVNVNLPGDGTPGVPVPGDGWSARWTADLDIAVSDSYMFNINCQDGTRMWIDGQLIIDQWITPTVTSQYFSLPIQLEPGFHAMRVEYFDSGGDAVEQLGWSTPTMAEQIIPPGPLQPPYRAHAVYPKQDTVEIPQDVVLKWTAGIKAAKHDIYFGTDKDAVASATAADAQQDAAEITFDPGQLEWNTTYYWRVDEVNDADAESPWTGAVWSFTTADSLVIDDMESYSDDEGNRIYETWIDGWTNNTGSVVGNLQAPFAELTIVNSGWQSMPLNYDNISSPFYSEAELEFSPAEDWTVNGVDTLALFFRGAANNGEGSLYVAVEDAAGKVVAIGSDADLTSRNWTEWKLPLSDFAGVDATQVKKLYVGVGDRNAPAAGGTGVVYIDDIRVIKP